MKDSSFWLYIETEVRDVSVLHDVIFSFQTDQAFFFGSLFAAAGDEVVVGHDFGADEAAFDIGVDLAGRFLGFRAVDDGPGADFVSTGSEEVDQAQEGIAGFDQFIQARFGQAQFFQEDFGFVVGQFGEFCFDLGRYGDDLGAFLGGVFFDAPLAM